MGPGEMSIGALARDVGVSTATINFYVKEGVLPPPRPINRTRAAYSERHVRLLRLIRNMQSAGFSLAHVKAAFARYGADEAGLRKIEGVGLFQAPPLLRLDRLSEAPEPFEPLKISEFAERAGVEPAFVRRLQRWHVVRPVHHDRFDVRDLWVVRATKAMVDDGVPLERLRFLAKVAPIARDASEVIHTLAIRHRAQLESRELRFRDLLQPLLAVVHYAFARAHEFDYPGWSAELLDLPDEQSAVGARTAARTATPRPPSSPLETPTPSRPRSATAPRTATSRA